jgi:hypothetical protein
VILRPYEGTVRIAQRVFQSLLDQRPTPEPYIEAFHLRRVRFETESLGAGTTSAAKGRTRDLLRASMPYPSLTHIRPSCRSEILNRGRAHGQAARQPRGCRATHPATSDASHRCHRQSLASGQLMPAISSLATLCHSEAELRAGAGPIIQARPHRHDPRPAGR